ncbi:hypothetical protein [Nonomuraea sp. LPB2021202275-12-8]|uniref:hypothetical protein n=1 Tax=Nonomuraea sp. LPB2021202275-12-8 TaxID=3120159 RepID=UPI00300D05B9
MSRLGPIVTLTAGAVLAVGLGVASITATPAADNTVATANETANETPNEAPEETPEATNTAADPNPSETPTFEESTPAAPRKADYAGRVKGNGGLIAISLRDGKAVGYFCDGKTEAWFKGDASSADLELEGFGGAKVTAELGGGKAEGQVAVGGKKWSFVAPTAVKPSGLYRASAIVRGARVRAGWIVLKRPQGGFTQVGTAFLNDKQVPTPELNGDQPTSPVTVDGTTVTPEDVDGFIEEMQ